MKSDSVNRDIFSEDRLLVTVDLLDIARAVVLEKTAKERDQKREGAKRSVRRFAVMYNQVLTNCALIFGAEKEKLKMC